MAMKINPEGLDLIKHFEGLMTEAYVDPVGIWTIGYGHIEGVKPGDKITEQEAEDLLISDLPAYERGVANLVTVPINENEFSALVSFAYNVGVGALKSSTALRRLNAGDRLGAADALEWWNKGRVGGKLYILPGLARRRAAEKALFLKPVMAAPATSLGESGRIPPTTKETPNRRENLAGSRTVQGGAVAAAAGATGAVGAASQSATRGDDQTEAAAATTTTTTTEASAPAEAPSPETPPAGTELPAGATAPPVSVPVPPEGPAPTGPSDAGPASSAEPDVPPISPPPNMTAPGSGSSMAPNGASSAADGTDLTSSPSTAATATATAPTTSGTTASDKGDLVHRIDNLFDNHPEIYTIVFALIVLAAIYVLWARIDDWRKGFR